MLRSTSVTEMKRHWLRPCSSQVRKWTHARVRVRVRSSLSSKIPKQNTNDQFYSTKTSFVEPINQPSLTVRNEKQRSILNSFGELAKILDNVKQHIINDRPLNALWLLQKLNEILFLNFRYHWTAYNKTCLNQYIFGKVAIGNTPYLTYFHQIWFNFWHSNAGFIAVVLTY